MSDIKKHEPFVPDTLYLRFFGFIALIVAVLMLLGGIVNEDKLVAIAALIVFLLGIIIIGIGTLITAINSNRKS